MRWDFFPFSLAGSQQHCVRTATAISSTSSYKLCTCTITWKWIGGGWVRHGYWPHTAITVCACQLLASGFGAGDGRYSNWLKGRQKVINERQQQQTFGNVHHNRFVPNTISNICHLLSLLRFPWFLCIFCCNKYIFLHHFFFKNDVFSLALVSLVLFLD